MGACLIIFKVITAAAAADDGGGGENVSGSNWLYDRAVLVLLCVIYILLCGFNLLLPRSNICAPSTFIYRLLSVIQCTACVCVLSTINRDFNVSLTAVQCLHGAPFAF